MVNGVVDIPFRRGEVLPGAAPGGGHFFAGPENCLAPVAIRSVLEATGRGLQPAGVLRPQRHGQIALAQGLAAAWKSQARSSAHSEGDSPIFAGTKIGTVPRPVVSTTAVDFARGLAEAIETQAVEEFRAKHRGASLWVLEDLGQLATRRSGKLSAQEELIHTLDALVGTSGWAVITCCAAGRFARHPPGPAKPADERADGSHGAARNRKRDWQLSDNWPPRRISPSPSRRHGSLPTASKARRGS